jgi:hypothetical protein
MYLNWRRAVEINDSGFGRCNYFGLREKIQMRDE